jgi:hypothetical protein
MGYSKQYVRSLLHTHYVPHSDSSVSTALARLLWPTTWVEAHSVLVSKKCSSKHSQRTPIRFPYQSMGRLPYGIAKQKTFRTVDVVVANVQLIAFVIEQGSGFRFKCFHAPASMPGPGHVSISNGVHVTFHLVWKSSQLSFWADKRMHLK